MQNFGENPSSPIQTISSTLHADACHPIDFDLFGAEIDLHFSALIQGDVNTVSAAKVVLIAGASVDDVTGTVLAELDPPITGTGGAYLPFEKRVTIQNPGGTKYLVVASQAGS